MNTFQPENPDNEIIRIYCPNKNANKKMPCTDDAYNSDEVKIWRGSHNFNSPD